MTQAEKISLFLLRISIGWLLFYAGLTKVLEPTWSAAGYLAGAKTFTAFYTWLASPGLLPIINFLNAWGVMLLGLALILGLFVRLSSWLGVLLMLLYYLPILDFPYPDAHSLIVDQHVIYALALIVLASFRAGSAFGLETWCSNLPICSQFPRLRKWLG
ncbi:MAG: DoxX family membrane protein [Candidatus Kerfeldbacteria bacterium]|nr:DoxX family membrane protein [Candidatus Kerfeldbacteria bacterium]